MCADKASFPADFPYSFYFNGHEMPKWSSEWHMVFPPQGFKIPDNLWDEFIDINHLGLLSCRIDHLGVVESEDAEIFIVCAQALLEGILENKDAVIARLNKWHDADLANTIYSGVLDGLFEMIKLAAHDHFAFWTNGGQNDLDALLDRISRSKLDPSDPAYCEPPHITARRHELLRRKSAQIKKFHRLAQSGRFEKQRRKQLQEIGLK